MPAGGIFVSRHREQCCSKGEWRQLRGSFEQILQTTCLVSASPTFVSHQVGILTALSTNQICTANFVTRAPLLRKYGKRKAICCCAAKHGHCGIQPPDRLSLKTLSQFPFYVFNHPLRFYVPDIFSLHRVGIYLAFNIYLLLGFCS